MAEQNVDFGGTAGRSRAQLLTIRRHDPVEENHRSNSVA